MYSTATYRSSGHGLGLTSLWCNQQINSGDKLQEEIKNGSRIRKGEDQLGSRQSLPIRASGSLFLLVFFKTFIIGFLFSYVHSLFLESFLITDFEKVP